MARIRTIKPEFFTSEDILELSPLARLFYIGLWCEADKAGRLQWRPKTLKLRYLPGDDADINAICAELVSRGLVKLYGDGNYAVIPSFPKHQHINPREAESKIPCPTYLVNDASVTRDDASVTRDDACKSRFDAQGGREGKGRERKGKEGNDASSASPEISQTKTEDKPQEQTLGPAEPPKPFVGFFDETPEGLARHFRMAKVGVPNSQESEEACVEHFRVAIKSGVTAQRILEEIKSSDRNKSEAIWHLLGRLTTIRGSPASYGKKARLTPRELAEGTL